MSFQHRVFAASALLAVVTALGAHAQAPAPRRDSFRSPRMPYGRFEYRLPRLSMRFDPRMRFDRGELGRRIMERSLERMNRSRELRFGLQDRLWRRQLETQNRAMGRLRERMGRFPTPRPFSYRRHLRTI